MLYGLGLFLFLCPIPYDGDLQNGVLFIALGIEWAVSHMGYGRSVSDAAMFGACYISFQCLSFFGGVPVEDVCKQPCIT